MQNYEITLLNVLRLVFFYQLFYWLLITYNISTLVNLENIDDVIVLMLFWDNILEYETNYNLILGKTVWELCRKHHRKPSLFYAGLY